MKPIGRFAYRPSCPSCGVKDGIVEVDMPFASGMIGEFIQRCYRIDPTSLGEASYQLVRCRKCTLVYQSWVGDATLLAQLYGEWIEDAAIPEQDVAYRELIARPLESRDGHEILTAATYLGRSPLKLTTLDYGMGWALWARTAKALGCGSYGTELSPERVKFARSHGIECIDDTDLTPETFDFINTEQVLEHLPEVHETVNRLTKALKRRGILKISVPRADDISSAISALRSGDRVPSNAELMPIQPLEHINAFTTKAIQTLADDFGLRVVRPSVAQRYAFLRKPGTISAARPKNSMKELVRPLYQWRNPHNLYVWLQKQA